MKLTLSPRMLLYLSPGPNFISNPYLLWTN